MDLGYAKSVIEDSRQDRCLQIMPKARKNDQFEVARAVSVSVRGAWIAGRITGRIIPAPKASINTALCRLPSTLQSTIRIARRAWHA
jgi:hypothetical protein